MKHQPIIRSLQPLTAALLGGLFAIPALAQGIPNAGRLLEEIKPPVTLPNTSIEALPAEEAVRAPLSLPTDIRIKVSAIQITGALALSEQQLQPLVADLIGGEHSLAELEQAAQRITQYYRQQGYMLARAYLPAQAIKDGKVEIHILEGRLDKIKLNNQSRIDDAGINDKLTGISSGRALKSDEVEKNLLLLSDTPGIDVRSSLRPGTSVGTTDLDILVKDGKPFDADLSVDNFGNRYSGEYRLNGNLSLNNPFGLGDALQVRSTTAGEKFNYVRLSYQLPLNDRGTRLGVAYAAMQYKLGEDFKRLDAHGTANIASLFLTHPFIRSRAFNLNGQINVDHKVLNDRIDLIGTESNKKLNNLTFGLSGDSNDQYNGGGINQASLSMTVGDLQLDSASAAFDAVGHRTQGRFMKTNLQALRLQKLTEQLSLYGQLTAQLAGDNLDSAEKMSLGGSYGVRAYPQGEAPADDAWLINLELRYAFAAQWQTMLFYDAAQGRINHKPIAADGNNRRNLSGVGAGIKWANQDGYSLQTTVAWRTDDEPTSDKDKLPRVWLQFAKSF